MRRCRCENHKKNTRTPLLRENTRPTRSALRGGLLKKVDCVNHTERRALHRPWARARDACACACEWLRCLSVHRVGGGIVVSQGMCARQLRVCVHVCVYDTDGCANGKTDRCLGGSNGMQWWSGAHSRGEIRAKTSSIGGESPITNPSTEPAERRRNGQTHRWTRGETRGEGLRGIWFPRRIQRRKLISLAIDERERRGAAAPHLAQREDRRRETQPLATHPYCSPLFFHSRILYPLFSPAWSRAEDCLKNTGEYFLSTSPTQLNPKEKLLFLTARWRKWRNDVSGKHLSSLHLNRGGFWAYLRREKLLYSAQCR